MNPGDQLQNVFLESTSEVLETMFFFGVLGEIPEPAAGADLVSAELVFHGRPSGRFGVRVQPSTGRLMASNFLGREENEVAQAEIEQVICELTNMICGSVLSRIEAGARFELLHPQIVPRGTAASTSHPEAASSCFELEQGAISVWMTTEESPLALS